jgi:CcmD family protein
MNTLAIAYALAWSAVAAYVGWMGLQHRRLRRRLDALESPKQVVVKSPVRRAA